MIARYRDKVNSSRNPRTPIMSNETSSPSIPLMSSSRSASSTDSWLSGLEATYSPPVQIGSTFTEELPSTGKLFPFRQSGGMLSVSPKRGVLKSPVSVSSSETSKTKVVGDIHKKLPKEKIPEFWDGPVEPLRLSKSPSAEICAFCSKPIDKSNPKLACEHMAHPSCLGRVVSKSGGKRRGSLLVAQYCKLCQAKNRNSDASSTPMVTKLGEHPESQVQEVSSPEFVKIPTHGQIQRRHKRKSSLSVASSIYDDVSPRTSMNISLLNTQILLRVKAEPEKSSIKFIPGRKRMLVGCLVTVSADKHVFDRWQYRMTEDDLSFGQNVTTSIMSKLERGGADVTKLSPETLRLKANTNYSVDGETWKPVTAYLYSNMLILSQPGEKAQEATLKAAISLCDELCSASIVTRPGGGICLLLGVGTETVTDLYLSFNKREENYNWVAALNNRTLQFPLTQSAGQLLPAFNSDYVERSPVTMIICLPEGFSMSAIAQIVSRLGAFDRIGIVTYGKSIKSFEAQRQAWSGWRDVFRQGSKTSEIKASRNLRPILSAAESLIRHPNNTRSLASIIFVSHGQTYLDSMPSYLTEEAIPISTIGVESHNCDLLSRISASTGGAYFFARSRTEAQTSLVNIASSERSYTHRKVTITLKSLVGSIADISGYEDAPSTRVYTSESLFEKRRTTYNNISVSPSGDKVVTVGSLRAGEEKSLFIHVELDSMMLNYVMEGSTLGLLDVTASGSMMLANRSTYSHASARPKVDFTGSPTDREVPESVLELTAHRPLDSSKFAKSITTDCHMDAFNRSLVLGTADILERILILVDNGGAVDAVKLLDTVIANTKDIIKTHASFDWMRQQESYDRMKLLCSAIGSDLGTLRNDLLERRLSRRQLRATTMEKIWVLKSGKAFSRRSQLEGIHFDQQEINIL